MEAKNLILLIEDDAAEAELTRQAFSLCAIPHWFTQVATSEAGEYLFNGAGNPPALVLIDPAGTGTDRHELLRSIRGEARTSRLPVVAFSASRDAQDIAAAYGYGVNSFIHKPATITERTAVALSIARYWLAFNRYPFAGV